MDNREPYSSEAELGVIGALMLNPDLCEQIGSFLDTTHFYSDDSAALYSAILLCHSRKQRPDWITLAEVMPEMPSGSPTLVYAGDVMRNTPSAANGVAYARVVLERFQARKLYEAGERIMQLAMTRGKIADQIATAQGEVMALNVEGDKPEVYDLAQALAPVFDEMESRWKGEKAIGLDFGLPDLDSIVRSMRPGNLVIIAGRPGTGKTVLGVGLAETQAIKMHRSALVFSLEMPKEELAKRSLAAQSEVPQQLIETGAALDSEEHTIAMEAAVSVMRKADLRICEIPALPFNRLCAIARFQHRAKPLDLIVVDYIGLVGSDPSWRFHNRNLELGAISRGLKALAKELGLPVVALAQLNRSIEGRADAKPKMSDLRDSGEIEQDADVIIMAHRDPKNEYSAQGVTDIEVPKVRHGQPGGCLLQLQGGISRFVPSAIPRAAYDAKSGAAKESDQRSSKDFLGK